MRCASRRHSILSGPRSTHDMPDFLDLPGAVVERLALVRQAEPVPYIAAERYPMRRKHYMFWVLREVGHAGVAAAAWRARHRVVRATLRSVAVVGDTEWCAAILKAGVDQRRLNDALCSAASHGHAATAALLLRWGARPDANSRAPFRAAAEHGHAAVMDALLAAGATPPPGWEPAGGA